MTTGKTIALSTWTFVGKVMSLLFTMLSRFVIAFLPRSKHLLISWLHSPSAVIFGAQENSLSLFPLFPHLLPWSDGIGCHDLGFLNVEFQVKFLTLLFNFHQEVLQFFFIFCHKDGVIYISEVIDISPSNLDSSVASSSLAFCMMYSAYKLNKQGNNIQPWRTPFPIWNQFVVPRTVLTVASWPTYRFLRRQEHIHLKVTSFPSFWSLLPTAKETGL